MYPLRMIRKPAFAVLGLMPLGCLGATLQVGPTGCNDATGQPYCSIAGAIAHAGNNDVIQVAAGTYFEHTIIGASVELRGAGRGLTIIEGSGSGRPVTIQSGATVTVRDLTVQNGAVGVGSGGGVFVNTGCNATLINVDVKGNAGAYGGGIYNNGTLTVKGARITGNSAFGYGGGVVNGGNAVFVTTTIDANTAEAGGGIVANGVTALSNSTVSDNTAATDAGGVSVISAYGATVTLSNTTVAGNNTGGTTGGILSDGQTVALHNTIIAGNTGSGGSSDCGGSGFASLGYNYVGTNVGCALAGTGDLVDQGTAGVNLGPLADNGGPTPTRALLAGSTAIDAGDHCLAADQRGVERPLDGNGDGIAACDIGAYEAPAVSRGGSGGGGGGVNDWLLLACLGVGVGVAARRRV